MEGPGRPVTRARSGERAAPSPGGGHRAGQADPLAEGHRGAADGYHLLESEMVTLDLADTLLIDDRPSDERGRADLTFSRDPTWPGTGWESGAHPRRGREPGGPGPGRRGPHGPGARREAGPARGRTGRGIGRRRRRSAVGRLHRPGGGLRPGRRRALLPDRREGPGRRCRRGSEAASPRGSPVPSAAPAVRGGHRGRLPGLGRAGGRESTAGRDGPGGGARGERSRVRSPAGRAPARGMEGTARGASPASGPNWPAAARAGSSRDQPRSSASATGNCFRSGTRREFWLPCARPLHRPRS